MRLMYSVLFWTFFAVTCVPLFCVALVIFLLTRPFDKNGRILHLFSCAWAQLYIYANPLWRIRVENRSRIPWNGPAVLVSNHQSLGDILVLFGLYRPFKWVSKASVFNIPFLGWNMRINQYVPLVRGDKDSIGKMMAQCEAWLDRGVPVLLFPEGTRSPDGEVKAFKDGAFRLALAKGCPVIPIVLSGTARTLPKHGFILQSGANCVVRVLEPISVKPFAGKEKVDALREYVRTLIIEEKAKLDSEQEAHGLKVSV